MFVAVVYKYHLDTFPRSHRPQGGWESFLGVSKDEAIEQAARAIRIWEATPDRDLITGKQKFYGPYQILVGELVEEAKTNKYELVKVDESGYDLAGYEPIGTETEEAPF